LIAASLTIVARIDPGQLALGGGNRRTSLKHPTPFGDQNCCGSGSGPLLRRSSIRGVLAARARAFAQPRLIRPVARGEPVPGTRESRVMQRAMHMLIGAGFLLGAVPRALSLPSVQSSDEVNTAVVTPVGPNEFDIVLTKEFGTAGWPTTFTITTNNPADRIRRLTVRNREPSQQLRLYITVTGPQIASIGSVQYGDGADDAGHGDASGVALIISMAVAGDVGDIKLTRVFDSYIAGSITGSIDLPAVADYSAFLGGGFGLYVGGDIRGNILLNEVSQSNRSVLDHLRVAGRIGDPAAPVTIKVGQVIRQLYAGELNAHIIGTGTAIDYYLGVGWIERLEIGAPMFPYRSGNFTGSIRTAVIGYGNSPDNRLWFSGDMMGTIILGEGHQTRNPPAITPEIKSTKPGGLKGRIIINDFNNPAYRVWNAPVRIGPNGTGQIVLNAPGYSRTAASLGGGTVGLVPIQLHATDCVPPNSGTLPFAGHAGSTSAVVLRFYGPVEFVANPPLAIQGRPLVAGAAFQTLTDCCAIQVDPENNTCLLITPAGAPPGVPAPKLPNGWEFRITPTLTGGNRLRSVTMGRPSVGGFTHSFTVGNGMPADIDGNGCVELRDIAELVGQWGRTGCWIPGDINGDRAVTLSDVSLVLAEWAEGCAD
jgi:hypothetical protein